MSWTKRLENSATQKPTKSATSYNNVRKPQLLHALSILLVFFLMHRIELYTEEQFAVVEMCNAHNCIMRYEGKRSEVLL